MRSIRYERARLRKVAQLAHGPTVLDIGYAQTPNPYLKECQRVGYDLNLPSSGAIRYEEEVRGDVSDIASVLEGRTFDTVICGELIEHLENPYALLRDVNGLLKPGGCLIITTPNPISFPVFFVEFLRLRNFFYTTEHCYYFLPRWVIRMLEFTGFKVAKIKSVGWWLPFGVVGLCPVSLSYQVIYVANKELVAPNL